MCQLIRVFITVVLFAITVSDEKKIVLVDRFLGLNEFNVIVVDSDSGSDDDTKLGLFSLHF